MHQLAHHLRQLALEYYPAAAEAQYAEFWAHCRRHSSGVAEWQGAVAKGLGWYSISSPCTQHAAGSLRSSPVTLHRQHCGGLKLLPRQKLVQSSS